MLHEILGTAAEPSRLKQVSLQRQSAALGLLAQARDRLDERADDLASDPHFFVVRIELGALLGEPLSHLGALADQGLRRYPRYTQLYFTTLDTILAADGVTPQDLEQLSRRSAADHADESRFGIYARLVWHVVERTYPGDPAFLQEIDWDRFRLGMSAVLGTYPDAWNVNNFAYISCLAADSSATSRLLATIKEQPILEAWRGRDAYDACRNWVDVASVSPQGQ